ncbi:MAG: ABC transporter ATP-binding protein, partial [Clostridia bacterium]|nr:ABC transporter ATP-binding protein [Clostridia bacterium]
FNDEIENLKQKLHKVQLAFERVPDTSIFEQLDIVKTEKTGSLLNLVVRGNREEIMTFLKRLNPIFIEAIEPSFEEIFMYELEVRGYDAENIIK